VSDLIRVFDCVDVMAKMSSRFGLTPGDRAGLKVNTVQLRSRMVISGLQAGCGHRVCWARLAAHLRTLRLTTRGLARARRTGLRRWASFPIAHCQRAPIASRL
jgi:hypothetical protein